MGWTNRFYAAALFCGLVPLTIGTGIFLLWCVNDYDWLAQAGAITIFAGIASALLGMVCLIVYALASLRSVPKGRLAARTLLALALLAAVFPGAYGIAKTVADTPEPRAQLFVANDGPAIASFVVFGASVKTDFGEIPSGGFSQRKIAIKRDGKLEFRASLANKQIEGVVAEHVTRDARPDWELTISSDGTWSVEDLKAH